MVDSSWIFHSQLPLTHFSSCFFANYCHLLSFFKKSQNCNVTNFCIISNLFHHKYNDKSFSNSNKKSVSLQNQFPRETSFPAKPVSPRNQLPRETRFPAKPVSPRNQFSRETSFPAKPVSPRNQFPHETNFPAKPDSLQNQFPRKTSFTAKPVSPRNQFPCKTWDTEVL